ncbi:hypothetical protein [Deinococcus navajonensis]|uniref:Uncharacterized protein n=1 Tax=Deinococcus navajonensis TaxID=309884 RepID=A0ABV8XJK9_9DEIO
MTAVAPMNADSRMRARFFAFLRMFVGLALLGSLAYLLWNHGEWPAMLMAWVLLVLLADEMGGWFGYIGLLLGALPFVAPGDPPAQWMVILPLVGGTLMAVLLIKHSGGPLVLPFAGLLFAGTLLATGRFGLKIDPQLTLPANAQFQRTALVAMALGLGFSFVRQVVASVMRRRARLRAQRGAVRVLLAAPGVTTRDAVPGADTVNSTPNDETSGK